MQCPKCNSKSSTIETRTVVETGARRRRRECQECGFRFTTIELMSLDPSASKAQQEEVQGFVVDAKKHLARVEKLHARVKRQAEKLINMIEEQAE